MKGQAINIDFAVAAGLFVTGLVTAFSLAFAFFQPQPGFTETLRGTSFTVADQFSEEVDWSVQEVRLTYPENNLSFLSVTRVGSSFDALATVNGSKSGFDTFGGSVVTEVDGNESVSIYSSGSELANVTGSTSKTFNSGSFTNNRITVSYSSSGIDGYSIDGREVVSSVSIGPGISSRVDGDFASMVNYSGQEVFFYGDDQPGVFLRTATTTLTAPSSLSTAETVDSSYDLQTSQDISGSGPLILHNSSYGVSIGGPGISWHLTDSGGSDTTVEINGSYYLAGFSDVAAGRDRVSLRSSFPGEVETEKNGARRSELTELFSETEETFSNRLDIPGTTSFNISFDGRTSGDLLPASQNVISKEFSKNILEKNGSLTQKELKVRLWR
ncbi:MAG: hypothetical protein ABEJ98_05440 [Candidatus Nanohaloarchaea archaeon]